MPSLPRLHICIIQPLGYVHAMALLDAALYVRHQLNRFGGEVTVAKNRLVHDAVNLIFGAHLGFEPDLRRRYSCLFVNLEQLGPGGSAQQPEYLQLLRSSAVADYDAANVAAYAGDPADVPLLGFAHAPYLATEQPQPLHQRPIDLLFYGSLNERRRALIASIEAAGTAVTVLPTGIYGPERDAFVRQAKLILNLHFYASNRFEQVRAFQALSCGTPLLSERTPNNTPPAAYADSVFWATADELPAVARRLLCDPGLQTMADLQLARFAQTDPVDDYADLAAFCAGLWTVHAHRRSPEPWRPERVQLGSGKDYRPGWLNVDVLPRAQPDVLLNLSTAQNWPLRLHSRFVGDVELAAGTVQHLYANNVLEHVTDLVGLMTRALELLAVGGRFEIEVPYEKAPSAWQDPTHIRAMNENSWVYYTDWFWYLGWFEHRFELRTLEFLDHQLKPCAREQAHFMRALLEKVQTTVADRTTARTFQPDFGGMLPPLDPRPSEAWPVPDEVVARVETTDDGRDNDGQATATGAVGSWADTVTEPQETNL